MRVAVLESIGAVEPARWDALGADPLSTHAVLAALEAAGLPGVSLWYALVEDDAGRTVGAAPLARVEIDGERLTHGVFRSSIGAVRHAVPDFLRTALMVCGTPLSVGNPPARLAPGGDGVCVLRELAGLLGELGDAERAPWRVFKEFASPPPGLSGWIVAPSESNSGITLRWPTFDAYVGSLRSAYRYKIRKAARHLVRSGIAVDVVPLAEGYGVELHALYEAVVDRAAVQLERLTPAFFTALGHALGDRAPLIRFTRDGVVVGWVAMLFADRVAVDLFHGIDYAVNESADLYFNQLAEVVRLAIARGARYLSLGQSTEVAKARFGAGSVPLWIALRHRSSAVTAVLRAGRTVLFPAKRVPPRHVFKSAAAPQQR